MSATIDECTTTNWGIVESTAEACWVGTTQGGCLARRAASCLLAPTVGDKVLLSSEVDGTRYILAILERGSGEAIVQLPAQTSLQATALTIESQSLALRNQACSLHTGSLSTCAKEIETVADSVRQHARTVFRRTDESEEVHAGSLRTIVKTIHSLRCSIGRWVATTLAKIDSDQVHLG